MAPMPGTRDVPLPKEWFEEEFGFAEASYDETRTNFEYSNGLLFCKPTNKYYKVGDFEVRSLEELRFHSSDAVKEASASYYSAGGLTFRNVVGRTVDLHRTKANAGAVFQVASLFNGLESVPVGTGPRHGVASYAHSPTQGPAAALSCPAALVYRNYFWNGDGQGDQQVNFLAALHDYLDNGAEGYWTMRNGFCMPKTNQSMRKLSARIAEANLAKDVASKVQVGVHWETDVPQETGGSSASHTVCQVLCSCLPVGLQKQTPIADWSSFAQLVLDSVYESTLNVALCLAAERGRRVKVFLTLVGGGELGARRDWIKGAIDKALLAHRDSPLDVRLVHYAAPCAVLKKLERDWPSGDDGCGSRRGSKDECRRPSVNHDTRTSVEQSMQREYSNFTSKESALQAIYDAFQKHDENGDGVIDRGEFVTMLRSADENFFTMGVVEKLLQEADSDGDGVVHYGEFMRWVFNEDEDIKELVVADGA